jgi:rhamnogalacturonyl hydrolase YesR
MSLVEMLDYFPKSHPGYARNVKRFQSLAAAVKKSQDPSSGGWWLIMDPPYPSDPRNYIESSGSAMFTYGLLRGIRKGFLKEKEYGKVARRGYETLKREFISTNANGTLNWEGTVQVGSLGSNGTFEVSLLFWSSSQRWYANKSHSITSPFRSRRMITRVLGRSSMLAMSWRGTSVHGLFNKAKATVIF